MQQFIFYGNNSFFVAFSDHFDGARREVDGALGERKELGAAHTRFVEQAQHELVATAFKTVGEKVVVVDVGHLLFGEENRQASRRLGCGDLSHDVGMDPLLTAQEFEERAEHDGVRLYRRRGEAAARELHLPFADFDMGDLVEVMDVEIAAQEVGKVAQNTLIFIHGAVGETALGADVAHKGIYGSIDIHGKITEKTGEIASKICVFSKKTFRNGDVSA